MATTWQMIHGPYLSLSSASHTSGGESSEGSSAMAMHSTSHTSDRYTRWSNSSEGFTVTAAAPPPPLLASSVDVVAEIWTCRHERYLWCGK